MKTAYYDYPTRSIIDLIPPGEIYPGWLISRVSVLIPHRGQGIARRLMDEVLVDADSEQATLYLEVQPSRDHDSSLSSQQLVDFYSRCGFQASVKYGFPCMVRIPTSGD